MTSYTPKDLTDGWEFKILRSQTNAFRKPEVMRAALEEEARAGWELVEKFDDNRLRLKRPRGARANDSSTSIDPYRTNYGIGPGRLAIVIVLATLVVVGGLVVIIKLATS